MPRVAAAKKTVVAEIPEASEVSSVVEEVKPEAAFKGLTKADMAKLLLELAGAEVVAAAASEKKAAKKTATKKEPKAEKEKKEKKTGSQPKGKVPKQLMKPRAWVEWTLAHALENGWEEFVIHQTNKKTGEEEEIVMPASELNEEGCYVYEGTIGLPKYPSGRQMIQKEAMSLSKQRWAPKTKTGTHPELYEEFEAQYVEPADDDDDAKSEKSESSSKVIKRLGLAEKEAEKEAKKAEKEAEKAAKKAEKEAEKEAKKLLKEAEKAKKAAEKSTTPKKAVSSAKTPIPAAAAKAVLAAKAAEAKAAKSVASSKASVVEEEAEEEEEVEVEEVKPKMVPSKKATAAAPKPKAAAAPAPIVKKPLVKKDLWAMAKEDDDSQVHPWSFGGKNYLRLFSGEIWEATSKGELGAWVGVWDAKTQKIDDSVAEPDFGEDE
jgi:hypothetical protein